MFNAFNAQVRFLKKDEKLHRYYEDLKKQHGSKAPVVQKFREGVAQCPQGSYDKSEYIKSIRKKIKLTEYRNNNQLGSWKQVVDRVGETVAYAAIRQGTLPHLPHSWLRPGHGVKWPDSHEFVIQSTEWSTSWRDEIEVDVDESTLDGTELEQWMHDSCAEGALPISR